MLVNAAVAAPLASGRDPIIASLRRLETMDELNLLRETALLFDLAREDNDCHLACIPAHCRLLHRC